MKFLCVPCDTPMKLQAVAPPDRGSLSVVYTCPECGYEIAMLTNAAETQIVQSLGVRIGPAAAEGASASACPFSAMIPAMQESDVSERAAGAGEGAEGDYASLAGASAEAGGAKPPGESERAVASEPREGRGDRGVPTSERAGGPGGAKPPAMKWTPAAEARLANIPAFVRPMAKAGIEKFARENGSLVVDEKILDAARDFFGM